MKIDQSNNTPLIHMDCFTSTANENIELINVEFSLLSGECHSIIGIQSYGLHAFVNNLCSPPKKYIGQYYFLGRPAYQKRWDFREIMIISDKQDSLSFFSAIENIYIHQKSFLLAKADRIKACQTLLQELGLVLDLDKPVSLMNFAEKKLLDILRVCVCLPKIAVFYDTYTWLDHHSAIQIPVIIKWLKAHGVSVIYISESVETVLIFSDRISVFDQGSIQQTFTVNEVKNDPGKIIQQFSDLRMLYETADNISKIPNVLRHILKAREISISEMALNNRFHFLAEDMAKAFDSDGAIIYFVDTVHSEIIDTIYSLEKVLSCSSIRPEQLVSLCSRGQFQLLDFSKTEKSLLFAQENLISYMAIYSFSINSATKGLIQILYAKRHYPHYDFEEYLKLFSKEICIAMDNSRLLGRSVLLQESHHRIKNNLQIVSNLLFLQKAAHPQVDEIFTAAIKRINTIASIHNLLCHDESGNSMIPLRSMFQEICSLYRANDLNIEIHMDPVSIPYDKATSVALLVNELIGNTVKHAFVHSPEKEHKVLIQCFNNGTTITLDYSDNGTGIDTSKPAKSDGIGISIMETISSELGAHIHTDSEKGYHFHMEIPRSRIMAINPIEQRI